MARIPDPNALRRDRKDDVSWTILDPKGKAEPIPHWPLINPSFRELELWEWIWKRPQSVLWAEYRQEIEVALYLRQLALVEIDGGAANYTVLIRQMESLLLTTPSMFKARVRIGKEETKNEPRKTNRNPESSNLRRRLHSIPDSK